MRPFIAARNVTRGTVLAARNVTRGTVLADRLEVADSLWAKFMGLMGRRELPADTGLWLPASNGIHMFFMRIAIDAVFVSKPVTPGGGGSGGGGSGSGGSGSGGSGSGGGSSGVAAGAMAARRVLSVHRNLRPWSGLVPLIMGADGVLELPVGTIDASGTAVGDLVQIG
ncbi:MAG: DUF192 domain-containing protein [Chloroflexi bacterium]|nr:DUF192 domain-containing protein [Chloroflexota bacterium]